MNKTHFLILLCCALLLAACRGGGEPGDDTRPTPISDTGAAEGGGAAESGGGVGQPITLRLWTRAGDPAEATLRAAADAYAAANPGVVVVIEPQDAATFDTTVAAALAAGTAADLMQATGGAVCPLAPWLAAAPAPVVEAPAVVALDPAATAGFICDGTLYGLPVAAAAPWGLVVAANGAAVDVAWDFARAAAGASE